LRSRDDQYNILYVNINGSRSSDLFILKEFYRETIITSSGRHIPIPITHTVGGYSYRTCARFFCESAVRERHDFRNSIGCCRRDVLLYSIIAALLFSDTIIRPSRVSAPTARNCACDSDRYTYILHYMDIMTLYFGVGMDGNPIVGEHRPKIFVEQTHIFTEWSPRVLRR